MAKTAVADIIIPTGRCIHCGEPAEKRALFARAY